MGATKLERVFQSKLIKDLRSRFAGSIVIKTDPNYIQGLPDLLVLYRDKWVALECKRSANEKKQPNQEHYISRMNKMSYASFIYPENKEEVFRELEQIFGRSEPARSV